MPKIKKRVKQSGVFRTPEEFSQYFTTVRIIIYSHCYEGNPQYEQLMDSFLCILMSEYNAFRQAGIDPLEFVPVEDTEVTRKNVLAIMKDIAEKVEITKKLEGKNGKQDQQA